MEEINLDLESIPHNSVGVSVEPVNAAPATVNIQKDTSIGLELLMNKNKMGSGSAAVKPVSMSSVGPSPSATSPTVTTGDTKSIGLSPPSSPTPMSNSNNGSSGGVGEEIDLEKLLGEDLSAPLESNSINLDINEPSSTTINLDTSEGNNYSNNADLNMFSINDNSGNDNYNRGA